MFARIFALGLSGVLSVGLVIALTWNNLPQSLVMVPTTQASLSQVESLTQVESKSEPSPHTSLADVFFRDSNSPDSAHPTPGSSAQTPFAKPIEVSSRQFDRLVRQGLVLVKFGADWCGPCRKVVPELEKLAIDNSGEVTVLTVDIDAESELASRYGVGSIPHLILFRDGEQVDQWTGFEPADHLQLGIDKAKKTTTIGEIQSNPFAA